MGEQPRKQAKQWRDMNAGERAGGIIFLVIIVLIIFFAAKAVFGGGGKPMNDGGATQAADVSSSSSQTQTQQPSIKDQVVAWDDKYQYIDDSFHTDFTNLSSAANNGDMAGVTAACTQLQTDVRTAQSFPAIPDPQTASDFSSALSYFADGSRDCIDGTTNYDASLITKGSQEISNGTDKIEATAKDIQALSNQ